MRILYLILVCMMTIGSAGAADGFLRVEGQNIVKPDGEKLYIQGTNLGNWLNPEGYMFGMKTTNSPRFIDEMLCELVGPTNAAHFWKEFKENYITQDDIRFIAESGANTVRLPFHYKLLTKEDYMGLDDNSEEGFRLIDRAIGWCKEAGLYVILDMHDCPGGQTGDNIDDSYGYPWLITEREEQERFIDIWRTIARHYKDETAVLGYGLMNEALATYFNDEYDELTEKLGALYTETVKAVRQEDKNHIIILGGANWNTRFEMLDMSADEQLMIECHRYGGEPIREAIKNFIEPQQKTNRPMYMGEIGHGTMEWQTKFVQVMKDCNIGYTFWPYKKLDNSCMVAIKRPEGWERIVEFAEGTRNSYAAIREARKKLPQQEAMKILRTYLDNILFDKCMVQEDYVTSMGMK